MPRTLSVPSRRYAPGVYGPYSVDSFTNADTSALEWTATVEGWPTDRAQKLVTITVQWDTGASASWTFNGGMATEDGAAVTMLRNAFGVPQEVAEDGSSRKQKVASGTITAEVFQTIRTAITLAAVG